MRGLWDEINQDSEKQAPPVEKLARSAEVKARFELLREESSRWLNSTDRNAFPRKSIVAQLAEAMSKAAAPSDHVRVLSSHHREHGGGRRWFREEFREVRATCAAQWHRCQRLSIPVARSLPVGSPVRRREDGQHAKGDGPRSGRRGRERPIGLRSFPHRLPEASWERPGSLPLINPKPAFWWSTCCRRYWV